MSHRYEQRPAKIHVPVAFVCDLCGDEEPGELYPQTFKSAGGGHHLCPTCYPRWTAHVAASGERWRSRDAAIAAFQAQWDADHPEPVFEWRSRETTRG